MKDTTFNTLMVLAAIATAVGTIGAWLRPSRISEPAKVDTTVQSTPIPTTSLPAEKLAVRAEKQSLHESSPRKTAPPQSELPREFALADGEQKVLLAGQVTLSIQFNNVAGEEFPTLRLNIGDESTPHALLGAGERFKFSSKGQSYYASVLSIDQDAKKVRVRVDAVH